MKNLITSLLVIIVFCTCQSNNNQKSQLNISQNLIDTSIAIINDSTQLIIHLPIESYWIPTEEQLLQIDSILLLATQDTSNYTRILDFKKFYKQYVCYKDSTGDLLVYVNGFCHLMEFPKQDSSGTWKMVPFDWKTNILEVLDGGPCFWHMQINLTKKKFFNFVLNGMA